MMMVGRKYFPSNNYRYGFGGQEISNEIKGIGNSYTAEFWEYDPRIGRRWNIDPVIKVDESPYLCFSGNPKVNNDPDGADAEDRAKRKAEKRLNKLKSNGYTNTTYSMENDNAGNIRVSFQANQGNDIIIIAGFVEKRSWLGRRLNQGKQFSVGFGQGIIETADFTVNIFNPDPDKNSLVQTGKFVVNAVKDPIGTYDNIKKAINETDWRDPGNWGNIVSTLVTPGAALKTANKLSILAKTANRAKHVMRFSKNFVLNPAWKNKWGDYMKKRGWTFDDIENVLSEGDWKPHIGDGIKNHLNPGNSMSVVSDPKTGKSLVIDNVTKEIIQLSAPGFKY